jgi:CHAT domain-containing protein
MIAAILQMRVSPRPMPSDRFVRFNRTFTLVACAFMSAALPAAEVSLSAPGTQTATVAVGKNDRYRIVASAGKALELSVQQLDGSVELHLSNIGETADASPKSARFNDAGRMSRLRMILIADTRSNWQIEISSRSKTRPASYKIEVNGAHPITQRDRDLVATQTALNDAETLRRSAGSLESGNARANPDTVAAQYQAALDAATKARDTCLQLMAQAGRARFQFALGKYEDARDAAKSALEFSCGTASDDLSAAAERAVAERTLASAIGYLGDFPQSTSVAERALALYRQTGDRNFQAMQRANLSANYRAMGATQKALEYAQAALHLAEEIGDDKRAVFARESIAAIHLQRGELGQALVAYRQTLEKVAATPYPLIEAMSRNDMGLLYDQLGESEAATSAYAKAEALWSANGDQSGLAETLLNEGELALNIGHLDQAQKAFQRALDYDQAHGLQREQAHALSGLGRCALARGRYDEANRQLMAALDLAHRIGSVVHEASAYLSLGDLESQRNRTDEALRYYDQALAIAEKTNDAATKVAALGSQARVRLQMKDAEGARPLLEKAIALIEDERTQIDAPQLRTAFFASRRAYFDLYIDTLMKHIRGKDGDAMTRAAIEAAERARAMQFREQLSERNIGVEPKADAALLSAERNAEDDLHQAAWRQNQLSATASDDDRRSVQTQVDTASRNLDDARGRIRAADPHYAQIVHPAPPNLQVAQKMLANDDVEVLEYWLGPEASYLWTIDAGDVREYVLPSRATLDRASDALLASVIAQGNIASNVGFETRSAQNNAAWHKQADELAKLVFAPVLAHTRKRHFVVIGDGELQRVPFALFDAKNEYDFVYLPSLATLAQLRLRAPSETKSIAIIADPVLQASDPRIATHADAKSPAPNDVLNSAGSDVGIGAFVRLAHAQEEASAIASLLRPSDVWIASGFDANRQKINAVDWTRYGIAHFATHALIDLRHPELSGVVLSLFDSDGKDVDGFLRSTDIFRLRMPVDLVVLSVCDSTREIGRGAEGIFGLSRAFFYAGARKLLVSLWSVDDRASAQLMTAFYRHLLAQHELPSVALASAQAEMRKDVRWENPYYWAGFAIQGDWR